MPSEKVEWALYMWAWIRIVHTQHWCEQWCQESLKRNSFYILRETNHVEYNWKTISLGGEPVYEPLGCWKVGLLVTKSFNTCAF